LQLKRKKLKKLSSKKQLIKLMKISKQQILKNLTPMLQLRCNLRLQLKKKLQLMNNKENMMLQKLKKSQPKTNTTKQNSINKKLKKHTILT